MESAPYVSSRRPKTQSIQESVSGINPSECRSDTLNSFMKELPSIIKGVIQSELISITDKMSNIETSLNHMCNQYDDILVNLNRNINDVKDLKSENTLLRKDIDAHLIRIQSLEEENVRQQQWNRIQNIEIVGVPENKNENTLDLVMKILTKIGVTMDKEEVEFAHRVQARRPSSATAARVIVARFRHRSTKDSVLSASRKYRDLKLADIGISDNLKHKNIFINEHLTKYNKSLLKECKIKAKEANFKFVWTKNCHIYIRRNETSPPIPILTNSDLKKIV